MSNSHLPLYFSSLLYRQKTYLSCAVHYRGVVYFCCPHPLYPSLPRGQTYAVLHSLSPKGTGSLVYLLGSVNSFHVQNLQTLMIEVFKSLNHENPSFLWDLFSRKEVYYNLRIKDILTLPRALTSSFGTNSITFRGSILWNSTPDVIKSSSTVSVFGKNIKNWEGEGCNCKICK